MWNYFKAKLKKQVIRKLQAVRLTIYILRKAGVEEYKAQICAKAAYLQGKEADVFISVYGPLVGEITHQQQVRLFDISYREKKNYAKGVYDRTAAKISNALSWHEIDIKN